MERLLIDVNSIVPFFVSGEVSGIGRTTMELLQALAKMPELPFDVTLYSQNLRGVGGRNLRLPFKNRHLWMRHTPLCDTIVARCALRELLTGYDLMHIPHNYELVRHPERCIVTLHDALFMKAEVPTDEQIRLQNLVPPFARQCRHIITCSESSKADIVATMHVPEEKVTVVYWGIRHDLFRPSADRQETTRLVGQKFGMANPYFFTLSCNAKRKRADVLVRSFVDYCEHASCPFDLVLVWEAPPESLTKAVAESRAREKVHFLSGVTDHDLTMLYNGAVALMFPSSYEGFGLPLVEAMACGTPVVTCRNSSLGEIARDAAIYLSEPVSESIPKVIEGFSSGAYPLRELVDKGLRRASEFTWEKCASQTVEVYKHCLGFEI